MLYGMVIKGHPGTGNERAVRRLQWQYPEGVTSVAEYWFGTDDPSVVATVETDDPNMPVPIRLAWDDVFDIDVFPVTKAEEGPEMLRQMGPSAQG